MNKINPYIMVRDENRTNYIFKDSQVLLHHLKLKPGNRHRIYTSTEYKRDTSNTGGISPIKSVTVIPPPGQVTIHSSALDRPGQWMGTYEKVGAGIIFDADIYYEAIVESDFYCVDWMPTRKNNTDTILKRVLLQSGESFTFDGDTELAISMIGTDQFSAFEGESGEQFTCDQITLLVIVEKINV